jgi:hypothetical protein
LLIEAADRLFGNRPVGVVDEREPARAARFAIDRQHDLRRLAHGRQEVAQVGLGRGVRQVPNEQTD